MMSSNGTLFRVTGAPFVFLTQRAVTRSFDVFFDLRLNKRLSKQWRGWLRICHGNTPYFWYQYAIQQRWDNIKTARQLLCMKEITETEMLSFWCNFHHWRHRKLSKWQIPVQLVMKISSAWWRRQMETFSALLALCPWNSPVTGEFPTQRPVTRSFDVFYDLRLNKHLSNQSWGWWFETSSRPLWRHYNENDAISLSVYDLFGRIGIMRINRWYKQYSVYTRLNHTGLRC